jgi:hypothetical protein
MMTTTLTGATEAPGTAPPDGCPSALTALAYADDVTASSTTPEAAHTIDAMARHGDLWKWNCNVVKRSQVFGPDLLVYLEWAVAGAPAAECGHSEGPRYSPAS